MTGASSDRAHSGPVTRFAVGEFYSPMYDTREIERMRGRLWPGGPRATPGIDWRDDEQRRLCREVLAAQPLCRFPRSSDDPTEYFVDNGQYPPLDAWVFEGMLRHLRPRRMIEVGCGFSTLVSARVNRDELRGSMELTCIDPYPKPFLRNGDLAGVTGLRPEKVEDAPLELFENLAAGDVLFIDTSHTVKTGGDVTWLFNEILPRLRPGVVVHIHDIFLPYEYPESWVLEGNGWNEMYLVQSFLLFNNAFEILWGAAYMLAHHPDDVIAAFPEFQQYASMAGGSLWIQRSSA
jgi:predicted O-methyltransferase YrrM